MKKPDLENYPKEDLIALLSEFIKKLDKEKMELRITRERLRMARKRFVKLKATVKYQDERIVQLYDLKKNREPLSETVTT